MRAVLIVLLLAGAAFAAGCQSSSSTGSVVEERSVYGQPCNQSIRDAGLCRTVYR